MSGPVPSPAAGASLTLLGPQPGHSLGPVADDWSAIDVWLSAVADNSSSGSGETVKTYRYHLAKLRWYCENVAGRAPSLWSAQDVKAFKDFLAKLPAFALCEPGAAAGEEGYSPFRKAPGASSQGDILRFLHALFKALHGTGYLRANPMQLMKTGKARRLDISRAIDLDVFDLVLRVMDEAPRARQTEHQLYARDRFIFICLREAGLRASELVGARMDAVRPFSDPRNKKNYWVLRIEGDTAKGGKERTVPVTAVLLDALIAYRQAFGLNALPGNDDEQYGLILSIRTHALAAGRHGGAIKSAADRRYFGAWRDVGTRFGLHGIVKGRICAAVDHLEGNGDIAVAAELDRVSSHWLRHTFAKAALLKGQDLRVVAAALGHASVTTTMVYTEQDTLDLVRAWEREAPGTVAETPA